MKRGEVRWYRFKPPDKRRPVLILTRDSAIPVLNSVTVAPITRTVRGIPTEVLLNEADGLPETCAANLDNVQTVPQENIGALIAQLKPARMAEAAAALIFALDLDGP